MLTEFHVTVIPIPMAKRKQPKKRLGISFALQLIDTEVSVNGRFLGPILGSTETILQN